MAIGQASSSRYIALNDKVEDNGNRCKIINSTTCCTADRVTGQGDAGEHVSKCGGNEIAAFGVIDDADVCSIVFESTKKTESFYILYPRAIGTRVRKGYKRKDKNGIVRLRSWVCKKEGERHEKHINRRDRIREPKAITRFMRSHRKIRKLDLHQAIVMQQAGIRPNHIMRLLAVQAGGYHNLGFHITDMYNELNRQRQIAVAHGDGESAIAFLSGKQGGDLNLYFKYAVDGHSRLNRLLWADSGSRDDYRCFGDVFVFDSTYNTNHYKFSLVVLRGVNNHYSTCIFACALIVCEGDEGYDWVICTFLEAMNGRKLIAVVTDGDKSMQKSIKKFMPTANA
ncbi:protein FAR1-RELATED SEQUENCE 5-like [Coffea arabica]|uniref:Protein FAR1-RELATED SEQUENCE 5-like n=1 Tax=Coffea arabica TaxID=13443 RepID=A0A6P6SS79_COFAR